MKRMFTLLAAMAFMGQLATAIAQSQPESSTLVIETQQGSHHHDLKVGDRLNYQVKGGEMQRKGKIESVQDSSVTVGGQEIAFSSLDAVVHVKGHHRARGSGLAMKSLWGEIVAFLLFLLTVALWRGRSTAGQRGLILFFGVLAFAIFPLLLIVGLLMLAVGRKRYDLRTKYRLRKG
jgi:hypothetical protein